jgi:hypothetical protein
VKWSRGSSFIDKGGASLGVSIAHGKLATKHDDVNKISFQLALFH